MRSGDVSRSCRGLVPKVVLVNNGVSTITNKSASCDDLEFIGGSRGQRASINAYRRGRRGNLTPGTGTTLTPVVNNVGDVGVALGVARRPGNSEAIASVGCVDGSGCTGSQAEERGDADR